MKLNIFSENIYNGWDIDERKYLNIAKKLLKYYLSNVREKSCLALYFSEQKLPVGAKERVNTLSFDILYCGSDKTHEINREYRQKDYPADIITFAIFADSEDKFVFDGEINLGEIIIALDKVENEALKKNTNPDSELVFLLAHGILHLLGFDHQTEAEYNFIVELQNEAVKNLGELYE
ncbi:MAG: rRNA maturation RNase YbeY [Heliobacteriaceae bacterium]|nr:rRNA maturation RNase YbeY [Heliobacteriaceae bacterium]